MCYGRLETETRFLSLAESQLGLAALASLCAGERDAGGGITSPVAASAAECRAARSLGGPFDVAVGLLSLRGRWRKALRRYLPASPHRSTDRRRARAALRGGLGGPLAQTWALSRTRAPLPPTTAVAHESVSVSRQKARAECGCRIATGASAIFRSYIPRLGDLRLAPHPRWAGLLRSRCCGGC